jgi:anti-anti-sigma factor
MKLMNSEIKIVQPTGILNSFLAGQLCTEVDQVVDTGSKLVLIDLESVTFIDSSGLGGLVNAFKAARAAGSKVVLCSVCEQARMLLEITGMDQVFEIFPNQNEFTKALAQTA